MENNNTMETTQAVDINCTVVMDGKEQSSNDFIAILSKDNGDASIYYNTDALTLGMGLKILAKEFVRCMNSCTPEEQEQISAVLGESFFGDVNDDILGAENEGTEVNA